MSGHERYEELCALAATGDLTVDEFRSLHEHMLECAGCRACYRDSHAVTHEGLPIIDETQPRWLAGGLGLKRRFLARARREGIRMEGPPRPGYAAWTAAPVALAIGIVIGLVWGGPRVVAPPSVAVTSAADSQIARLTARIAEMERRYQAPAPVAPASRDEGRAEEFGKLREQLDSMSAARESAEQRAAQASQELARVQAQLIEKSGALTGHEQDLRGAEAELSRLANEMGALRSSHTAGEAALARERRRIADLTTRLREQEETIARERELLAAGRDIRDLMGARNLRIVDVNDSGSATRRGLPGRIFYTQGKSLIFYAYDLQNRGNIHKVEFQVWGKRDGRSQPARSLGIMYVDDAAQKRWMLKFEDPDVLARIDQVFVTAEPKGGSKQPTGRQLLSAAFLNDPANHP